VASRDRHHPLLLLGCDASPLVRDPLTPEQATSVAAIFKALSDPVRLRLLSMIVSHAGEVCVCDLTPAFGVSEPTISHHLRVLREAGLVTSERRASWVYYQAVPDALTGLSDLLNAAAAQKAGRTR
jgi:ArsR family transcriptional regulator, arsenate/arsenite/antimonite-responsive transcriptional repressor